MSRSFRVAALLLAMAVLGACAPPGPSLPFPGPDRARTPLDETGIAAVAEILSLEDHRRFDRSAFDRLVASDLVEVRRRAVVAAGRIGDRAATPFLLHALRTDPAATVRADAAFALGELGDTSAAVIAALVDVAPPSWVPVRAEEATVVVEALAALGKLGTREAGRRIADAVLEARPVRADAPDNIRRVAAAALLAAWRLGPATPVSRIAAFLRSEDPELRWRAAYALMRSGVADAAPFLLDSFDDPEHRVRAYAARALTRTRADSALVRDTALQLLAGALDDDHPHVRINALGALASYEGAAPLDAIAARLHDDDANVAIAAAAAAARVGARAADHLAGAAEDRDLPIGVRGAALVALAPLAPDRAADLAARWAEGAQRGDFRARWLAARALGAVDGAGADDVLRRLASDDDVRVAIAALEALATRPTADSAALRERIESLARDAAARGGTATATPLPARGPDYYQDVVRRFVAGPLADAPRPRAVIRTASGVIEVELLAEEAPLTVANFVALAEAGYFNGGVWHRVVPNFVLQDGAPGGYASGGPGWSIRDEINRVRYGRGTMGMALSGPDTGGSQWFITHSPQPHLDGGYTVFGQVIDGLEAADRVVQGEPISSIRIVW